MKNIGLRNITVLVDELDVSDVDKKKRHQLVGKGMVI
jgi:hypothetical protein